MVSLLSFNTPRFFYLFIFIYLYLITPCSQFLKFDSGFACYMFAVVGAADPPPKAMISESQLTATLFTLLLSRYLHCYSHCINV